jgi:hypothetical protein
MESLAKLFENAQTATGGVFVLSLVVLVLGIPFLARLGKDSPLAGNALQVLAIILLIPAAMYLGVTKTINAEAVTGIFGGIAGYVFARAAGDTAKSS